MYLRAIAVTLLLLVGSMTSAHAQAFMYSGAWTATDNDINAFDLTFTLEHCLNDHSLYLYDFSTGTSAAIKVLDGLNTFGNSRTLRVERDVAGDMLVRDGNSNALLLNLGADGLFGFYVAVHDDGGTTIKTTYEVESTNSATQWIISDDQGSPDCIKVYFADINVAPVVNPVPAPAAAWLLGSSLAVLVARRRG